MALNVALFLVLYIGLATGCSIWLHHDKYHVLNWVQMALAFFLPLNTIICVWEICLGIYIDEIKKDFIRLAKKWRNKEFGACMEFFMTPVGLTEICSLRFWTRVWSTYALYDPSYSNQESFGFFVDVSNGFAFLVPSLAFLWAMTYDFPIAIEARTLGIIGLIKFYTEFHGTVVYFLSYFFNKRYVGFSKSEVGMFVGLSNGLWFVFPLIGMYSCCCMIQSNSFDVFRT